MSFLPSFPSAFCLSLSSWADGVEERPSQANRKRMNVGGWFVRREVTRTHLPRPYATSPGLLPRVSPGGRDGSLPTQHPRLRLPTRSIVTLSAPPTTTERKGRREYRILTTMRLYYSYILPFMGDSPHSFGRIPRLRLRLRLSVYDNREWYAASIARRGERVLRMW